MRLSSPNTHIHTAAPRRKCTSHQEVFRHAMHRRHIQSSQLYSVETLPGSIESMVLVKNSFSAGKRLVLAIA